MGKYRVSVYYNVAYSVTIDADNEIDAYEKAKKISTIAPLSEMEVIGCSGGDATPIDENGNILYDEQLNFY